MRKPQPRYGWNGNTSDFKIGDRIQLTLLESMGVPSIGDGTTGTIVDGPFVDVGTYWMVKYDLQALGIKRVYEKMMRVIS